MATQKRRNASISHFPTHNLLPVQKAHNTYPHLHKRLLFPFEQTHFCFSKEMFYIEVEDTICGPNMFEDASELKLRLRGSKNMFKHPSSFFFYRPL